MAYRTNDPRHPFFSMIGSLLNFVSVDNPKYDRELEEAQKKTEQQRLDALSPAPTKEEEQKNALTVWLAENWLDDIWRYFGNSGTVEIGRSGWGYICYKTNKYDYNRKYGLCLDDYIASPSFFGIGGGHPKNAGDGLTAFPILLKFEVELHKDGRTVATFYGVVLRKGYELNRWLIQDLYWRIPAMHNLLLNRDFTSEDRNIGLIYDMKLNATDITDNDCDDVERVIQNAFNCILFSNTDKQKETGKRRNEMEREQEKHYIKLFKEMFPNAEVPADVKYRLDKIIDRGMNSWWRETEMYLGLGPYYEPIPESRILDYFDLRYEKDRMEKTKQGGIQSIKESPENVRFLLEK